MQYASGIIVLDADSITWHCSSRPEEKEDGLTITVGLATSLKLAPLLSSSRQKQALLRLENILSRSEVAWISPGDQVWRIDLDLVKVYFGENFPGLMALDWFTGQVFIEPEVTIHEWDDIGKTPCRYEIGVVFRVTREAVGLATGPTQLSPASMLPAALPSTVSAIRPGGILIVTATKTEAQTALRVFSEKANAQWTRLVIGNKTYYNLGTHGGTPVHMVQSEPGTATPGGALLTVSRAIQDLRPQAVIMCGFAFGLHQDKQQLGDILVAKQLLYYEPQKVDLKRGQMPRGDRVTSSERLLDRFRSGDNDWQDAQTHFGLVVSGEMLINDPDSRDWLLKTEPEAIGGEMEGAGLYAAARDAKVDWILVKAICDWADGEKTDAAQSLAARNAMQFVWHVLQLGGWDSPEQQREEILVVDSALWGAEDLWDEYAPFLNSLITPEGTLSIRAHIDNFSDWPRNQPKILKVTYTYKGQKGSKTVPEDGWLELP